MSQTYSQIKKQIAALEAQAETALKNELATVVAKLKETIQTYGLQPSDLFGKVRATLGRQAKAGKAPKSAAKNGAAKFADGNGNTWGGLGKRPQWLRDALAAGKQLQDFAVGSAKSVAKSAANSAAKPSARSTAKPAAKAKSSKPAAKAAAKKEAKPAAKAASKPAARKRASPAAKPAPAAKTALAAAPKAFPGKKAAPKKRAAAKAVQAESAGTAGASAI